MDEEIAADHLNGGLNGYDNSPLFALNSIYSKNETVDVSLIQSFFGQDELHVKAVENALQFMCLSNPRPRDWVFVEAQRKEGDARFKWVVRLGIKYVFVGIENDRQDYFIKEQLWNIGTLHAESDNLVFVDADVSYCQMDWLKRVVETFASGCQLFQPHSWSWRASEPDGFKGEPMRINDLNLTESFAHTRKLNKPLCNFNGHTGYDIAISREYYNSIGGFYSLPTAGGDFLMWSMLGLDNTVESPMRKICSMVKIEKRPIGCDDLVCFHNYHGSAKERAKTYLGDQGKNIGATNNFGLNKIVEMGR